MCNNSNNKTIFVLYLTTKAQEMKTATPSELWNMVWDNDYFGSINHVQKTNHELLNELHKMPDCTLHYVITGDCLMIFSKPSQQ